MKKKLSYLLITFLVINLFIFSMTKESKALTVFESGGNLVTNITNTVETVWGTLSKEVLEPAVKSLADQLLDKVVQQSLNWAFEGFDGDPSYINNFGDFIKNTKYDSIIDAYDQAARNISMPEGGAEQNPGTAAQQNYQAQNSDGFKLKRAAARSIALYGKQELGKTELSKIINSENETLRNLVGGEAGVNNFKGDFKEGGWGAYLELLNPNNTELGVTSIIRSELDKETNKKVDQTIANIQTPLKFLDKTKCLEYKLNETTGEQVCVRETILTPGDQVAEKVNTAITKDEKQAQNADGLIASLLRSAVGKLTSGIVDRGLAEVSRGVTSSFYNAGQDIFNNGSIDNQFGFNASGTGDGFGDNSTPNLNFNPGNSSYIGGPEDQLGYGQGGAQIIIDLESELETMITANKQEREYFDSLRIIRKENQETVIALDKCIPGPDSGWETRFRDIEILKAEDSDDNDITQEIKNLAFAETREAVQDPKINIPGASILTENIQSILSSTNQADSRNKQRIDALAKVQSSLNYIYDSILADFNIQKQSKNQNLVLFSSQWDQLSPAQKESAYTYAITNQFGNLSSGETAASVIASNQERAKTSVLKASWNIWTTETPRQKKSDLRYTYFVIQNDLSNEEMIARARAEANRVESEAVRAKQFLRDCLVFKLYALGMNPQQIQNAVNQGGTGSLAQINAQINQMNNSLFGSSGIIGSILGGSSSGGLLGSLFGSGSSSNPIFINPPNAPSDPQIKEFLLLERQKQQNNQPSLFLTNVITGGIDQSILGFETLGERENYFNTLYPNDNLPFPRAMTVLGIYKQDHFVYRGRQIGALFCRHRGFTRLSGGGIPLPIPACYAPWYKASKLDYALAFSGI